MNTFHSKSLSDNRKSAIQNLKWLGIVAIAVILAMCLGSGRGAAAERKFRGSAFWTTSSASDQLLRAPPPMPFARGFANSGYVEGKTHRLSSIRSAEGRSEIDLQSSPRELVRLKVDIIVALGSRS